MSNEVLIILMFVAVLVSLIALGGHLGFVLGTIGIVAGLIGWGGTDFLSLLPSAIWSIMRNYVLVAIPLFVFMGYMLERSGFAEDLFGGAEIMFGRLRGGMAVTVVIITTLTAMTTGVVATGVIMAGVLALPSMLNRGYNKALALGTIAAGGTLGILIPPSILLVFYASLTGLSVGKLFLGAFGPGFLLSSLFIIYVLIITTLRPKMAPRLSELPEHAEHSTVDNPKTEHKHPRLRALIAFLPMALLLIAVLGTIIAGIATPTEAAASGAFGAIIIAAIYRKLNFTTLKDACLGTTETMAMFGGILAGSMCFTAVFAGLGGKAMMKDLIFAIGGSPLGMLLVMIGIIFILGMFIDQFPILLITLPAFIPISVELGFDPLWFGMVICVTLQTSWLTPPFGYALFFLRGLNMPGVTFADICWGCVPFILLQLVGVGACIAFPQIVLWLPNLLIR